MMDARVVNVTYVFEGVGVCFGVILEEVARDGLIFVFVA